MNKKTNYLLFLSVIFGLCNFLSPNSVKAQSKMDLSESDNIMSQINSVSQLRDVSPTDWAFEALRSLVVLLGTQIVLLGVIVP
jgi:hypothetical protein